MRGFARWFYWPEICKRDKNAVTEFGSGTACSEPEQILLENRELWHFQMGC